MRCFLYLALVQSGVFRLELQPIRCFSDKTSDIKYTDTIKVTEDSIYSDLAENGAVESGRPLGRRQSAMSCHFRKLQQKSKETVFFKTVVYEIIIVFSVYASLLSGSFQRN